ncbi:MAG: ABC transporter substrate-binding protein [Candidatus Zixiibacteriota bacterium]
MRNDFARGTKRILGIANKSARTVLYLILVFLFLILVFSPELSAQSRQIAIVKTEDFTSYLRAIKGFKQIINQSGEAVDFIEYTIPEDLSGKNKVLGEIRTKRPDLILTVGSKSTELVSQHIKEIPIIFSAVLNPVVSGFVSDMSSPAGNLTGASLDVPLKIQLEKFKLIVPHLKSVGLVYTSETEPLIQEAQAVSRDLGIELVALPIHSEKEIPSTLEKLKNEVDGIWAVADPLIFTPQSTQFILLFTLRNGLPLMGLTPSFVQAGALFTLVPDYKDVGRQAGEMALEIISGKEPGQIPISVPRIIYLYLNFNTAQQINLEIPGDLLEVAKEVYK